MTKKEMRNIAKDILGEAVATAYYKLEEMNDLTEDEYNEIIKFINQYSTAMMKAIKQEYYTL